MRLGLLFTLCSQIALTFINIIVFSFFLFKPLNNDKTCYMDVSKSNYLTCVLQFILIYTHLVVSFIAFLIFLCIDLNLIRNRLYFKVFSIVILCCVTILYSVLLPIISFGVEKANLAFVVFQKQRSIVMVLNTISLVCLIYAIVLEFFGEFMEQLRLYRVQSIESEHNRIIDEDVEPGITIIIVPK